jgi:hypothetical protein
MRRDILLFLVLVALVGGGIIAGVMLVMGGGGGSGSAVCDGPQVPQGESDISQLGFQAQDVGLSKVIQAASAGDLAAVEDAFYGDVHGFTHNVDQPLRPVDEDLARDLCETVIDIEEELLAEQPRVDAIGLQAARIQDMMRDAAEALGYARPGE